MSKHLAASQAVALLDNLKNAVREFSIRATKLHEEFKLKVNREQHRRNVAAEEQAKNLTEQLAENDSAYESAKTLRLANFEKRKIRTPTLS